MLRPVVECGEQLNTMHARHARSSRVWCLVVVVVSRVATALLSVCCVFCSPRSGRSQLGCATLLRDRWGRWFSSACVSSPGTPRAMSNSMIHLRA